ncbi:MAG: lipopolysaccharide biosynthesis protein [Candidatus Melainabacteria bacterium]
MNADALTENTESAHSRTLSQRFIGGIVSGTGSVVVKTILNFLMIPVMIHFLGADHFGLYVLLVTIFELILMMELGFGMAIVPLLGQARGLQEATEVASGVTTPQAPPRIFGEFSVGDLLTMAHRFYLLLALACLALGSLLLLVFPDVFHLSADLGKLGQVALVFTLVEGALTLYAGYYRAILLSHCAHQWTNLTESLYVIISGLLAIGLLMNGYGLVAVVMVRLIAAVIRTLSLIPLAWRLERRSVLSFGAGPMNWPLLRRVAVMNLHALAIHLCVIVSHKIDTLVIGVYLPLQAVGAFEIVFRFLGIASQIAAKCSEGLLPIYSRMAGVMNQDGSRAVFLRMSQFNNLVVCLLLTLVVVFYEPLFLLVSNNRIPIEDTWLVLWMAVPIIWSGALQFPASHFLFSSGHNRYLTVSSVIAAIVNLVLSLVLVRSMGLPGVALGTLLPQLIQHQGSLIRRTCQIMGIPFREYVGVVHGRILLILLLCVAWTRLLFDVMPLVYPSIWQDKLGLLSGMGLVGLTTFGLAMMLWLRLALSTDEKTRVRDALTHVSPKVQSYLGWMGT